MGYTSIVDLSGAKVYPKSRIGKVDLKFASIPKTTRMIKPKPFATKKK
jgi:hypothetical protein